MCCFTTCILGLDDRNSSRKACPDGWLDESYVGLGTILFLIWQWCVLVNSGCILVDSAILISYENQLTLDDAYQFCYKLDNRARILEIHTEEQFDFLGIIMSIFAEYLYLWVLNYKE